MGNWSYLSFSMGGVFYWLCGFSEVKEILEYDGNIVMVRRWSQELLGYDFAVVHLPNIIMTDVDALSRLYKKIITTHVDVSSILKDRDLQQRPDTYRHKSF